MRCWIARWRPRPEPRPAARARARRAAAGLVILAACTSACVTRGTHEEALAERDRRIAELERETLASRRSVAAFEAERDQVLVQLEEARAEQAALDAERAALETELAARDQNLVSLRGTYDALVSDLEAEVAAGQIQVEQLREGIRLNLAQEVLFPLGSADLSPGGRDVIERVASRLVDGSHTVDVRGHTDNLAIHGGLAERYPSNWELAGARAASVVRVLQGAGVDPALLRATSYGEYAPAASNEEAAGRARNRRIEIWLRPKAAGAAPAESAADAAPAEPAATDAPPAE